MPQTLTTEWKEHLGNDYQEVYNSYLHNIGNLILTEFNSEIGNKSFLEKKEKIKESSLGFRLFILEQPNWTKEVIIKHQKRMISDFLNTFPIPSYTSQSNNWTENDSEKYVFRLSELDTPKAIEGSKPMVLQIKNLRISIKSWQELFIEFLRYIKNNMNYEYFYILNEQDKLFSNPDVIITWTRLNNLLEEKYELSKRYKNYDLKTWDKIEVLKENIEFIHINISANTCISRINSIINAIDLSEDDIIIELKQ
jgi:hypothetical protein